METAVQRPQPEARGDLEEDRQGPLERLAGFRFTYLAIFLFLVAYVFSVEALEAVMAAHFESEVEAATNVEPGDGPVAEQIRDRIDALLTSSPWIRVGRVRVRPIVLGADGTTLLFAGSYAPPVAPSDTNGAELLPAIVDVDVSVPHNALAANGILVAYAALLVTSLIGYTRRLTRLEEKALRGVMDERASMAERTQSISLELGQVRSRLAEVEPEKEIYFEEIESLQDERTRLRSRLAEVENREAALRAEAAGSSELNEERRALEELLEEATGDLESKDDEIRRLQKQVKRTGKGASKESDLVSRRLRTLYKELEVDDHAIEGILALGDESQKLRAEEALKKLCDDPENAGVRRKVGGLPVHLNVFELGFAGKGRVYTTKGQSRRFRVLVVGGKNSQKTDLEYLSRLPKGT
ncbi:MAG: hypothetical protein JRH01_17245 [Deltaproteobacteria bacterium]|nr:hypothetical protein [Deltaproteobacteria bacterium]MBW2395061.1 hypothetical protein [Deltaproteobacteria bacterium]